MSIHKILADCAAIRYKHDGRATPTPVKIKTSDVREVLAAIQECADILMGSSHKFMFRNGEGPDYGRGLLRLAKEVERLKKEIGKRECVMIFECTPDLYGGATLEVVVNKVKVEVFRQYYDSFTPGLCNGTVSGAVGQCLYDTKMKIDGINMWGKLE